jgi:hypothetical protein
MDKNQNPDLEAQNLVSNGIQQSAFERLSEHSTNKIKLKKKLRRQYQL